MPPDDPLLNLDEFAVEGRRGEMTNEDIDRTLYAAREIFVDTSGLYALVDERDAHHQSARDAVTKLLRVGRRLVVTDYVVAETQNLANALRSLSPHGFS